MSDQCPKNQVWDRILKKCRFPLKKGRKITKKKKIAGGTTQSEFETQNNQYLASAFTLTDDNLSVSSDDSSSRKKK
jgi:hypothetical protein